jgi:ribonuclease HI
MLEAILYFDGGIRQGIMGYGWLLLDKTLEDLKCGVSDKGDVIASGNKTCGIGTSNIAEYRALIAGLYGSIKEGVDVIHIIGDSQLVVRQVTGSFKAKKAELIKHRDHVLKLLEQFEDYSIMWVPRKENKRADALVNEVFERRKGKCSKQKRKRRS